MSKRLAILAVSTALATLSAPTAAQDIGDVDQYADVAAAAMRGGQAIEGWGAEPAVGAVFDEAAEYAVDAAVDYERREVVQSYDDTGPDSDWDDDRGDDRHDERRGHHRGGNRGGHHAAQSAAPRLAYGQAERAEWLSQCRALHARPAEPDYYYEDEDDGNEGLIGGLIGAVVGGFAGNRIADSDRLLGTVIGAGAGGIAGAVIGSVIDGFGDDEDERPVYTETQPTFDYCEAYLLNYERGYGTPTQVAYAPVMIVPTRHQQVQQRRYRVIEEEVEVDAPARQHHVRRAAPRREAGKLTRIN